MAVQMTCPYCKKEFPYYNGELDAEISKIGQRIQEIYKRLSEIKYGFKTNETYKEKRKLVLELEKLKVKIKELKTIRKQCDQQLKYYEYETLKILIRERFGEQVFYEILEDAKKEMEAYKLSSTMRHEYSRSNHLSNVTNINKL